MATLLSINNYFYRRGGAEAVFLEHGRLFEQIGWSVVPFAMQHPLNIATPFSRYFVDEIEFGSRYSLSEKLLRLPRVIYSLQARRNLGRLLDDVRVDIGHAHNIYHHLSPSILWTLRSRGIPTVLTLHDLKIACPAYTMLAHDGVCERCRHGRLHNVVLHRCMKQSATLSAVVMIEAVLHRIIGSYRHCVSRFVVPSLFYIRKFVDWGMPERMFRHIPNPIDANLFRPDYAAGERVLYFGRLSHEKGLQTLVSAAAAANCPLSIVGTGPELGSIKEAAVRQRADVLFLGYLTGDRLHEEVRRARAVVLPSEWYENAPMTVLEAYAMGKPVIGADIGGIPELIKDYETGFLFPSGDVRRLSKILKEVSSMSSASLEEMGRRARRWVEQDFSAAEYRRKIVAVYEELGVRSDGVA